jgi:hypothetical protein
MRLGSDQEEATSATSDDDDSYTSATEESVVASPSDARLPTTQRIVLGTTPAAKEVRPKQTLPMTMEDSPYQVSSENIDRTFLGEGEGLAALVSVGGTPTATELGTPRAVAADPDDQARLELQLGDQRRTPAASPVFDPTAVASHRGFTAVATPPKGRDALAERERLARLDETLTATYNQEYEDARTEVARAEENLANFRRERDAAHYTRSKVTKWKEREAELKRVVATATAIRDGCQSMITEHQSTTRARAGEDDETDTDEG